MSGLRELQMLAATRPSLDWPIELTTSWYRRKARVLSELAVVAELRGRTGEASRYRQLARAAHFHAETLAFTAEATRPADEMETTS